MAVIDQKALDLFVKQGLLEVPKSRAVAEGVNTWTQVLAYENSKVPLNAELMAAAKDMLARYTSMYNYVYTGVKKAILAKMVQQGLDVTGLAGLGTTGPSAWKMDEIPLQTPAAAENWVQSAKKIWDNRKPVKFTTLVKFIGVAVTLLVGKAILDYFTPKSVITDNIKKYQAEQTRLNLKKINDPGNFTPNDQANLDNVTKIIDDEIERQKKINGMYFLEQASKYLLWGVIAYGAAKVLGFLPTIIDPWANTATKIKNLRSHDEAPSRGSRASLPAPGYGYPAQQQQAPQNGGGYGPPPAPMPTPKKRPKTPPAAFKNRMKNSKKAKAGDSRYNGL